jgi:hypothetical protein
MESTYSSPSLGTLPYFPETFFRSFVMHQAQEWVSGIHSYFWDSNPIFQLELLFTTSFSMRHYALDWLYVMWSRVFPFMIDWRCIPTVSTLSTYSISCLEDQVLISYDLIWWKLSWCLGLISESSMYLERRMLLLTIFLDGKQQM